MQRTPGKQVMSTITIKPEAQWNTASVFYDGSWEKL